MKKLFTLYLKVVLISLLLTSCAEILNNNLDQHQNKITISGTVSYFSIVAIQGIEYVSSKPVLTGLVLGQTVHYSISAVKELPDITINPQTGIITIPASTELTTTPVKIIVTLTGTGDYKGTIQTEVSIEVLSPLSAANVLSYGASILYVKKGFVHTITPSWSATVPSALRQSLQFSITPTTAGVSIDASTGALSFDATTQEQEKTEYTISATGSGNYAAHKLTKKITIEIHDGLVISNLDFDYKNTDVFFEQSTYTRDVTWNTMYIGETPTVQYTVAPTSGATSSYQVTIDTNGQLTIVTQAVVTQTSTFTVTITGTGATKGSATYDVIIQAVESSACEIVLWTKNANNEYEISKPRQVLELAAFNVSVTYILTKDITLPTQDASCKSYLETTTNTVKYNANTAKTLSYTNFVPIGTSINPFTGNFDGKNYSIKNLAINKTSIDNVGLFGYVNNATIQNLKLDILAISGNNNVGALVGYASNSQILNAGVLSTANQAVLSSQNQVGGMVGKAVSNSTIRGYSEVKVNGNNNTGGLVGSLEDSIAIGFASKAVNGSEQVGGLVGYSKNSSITGYALGAVKAKNNAAGLVGKQESSVLLLGYSRGIISNTDEDSISNKFFGYVVGSAVGNEGKGYYSISESKIAKYEVSLNRYLFLPIAMNANTVQTKFTDFTFSTTLGEWTWVADGSWPALNIGTIIDANLQPITRGPDAIDSCEIATNQPPQNQGKYQISNEAQLLWINNCLNADYVLTQNITMTNAINPLASKSLPFTGSIDGANFRIKNLIINKIRDDYTGLFAYINNAEIKNLTIEHSGIYGSVKYLEEAYDNAYSVTGALAGFAINKSVITNVHVIANNNAEITSSHTVGGVVGRLEDSTISASANINIWGDSFVGGLVGSSRNSSVLGYSSGTIKGIDYVGGLVGSASESTIKGYSSASILPNENPSGTRFSPDAMGGLVGYSIIDNTIVGYFTGTVSGLTSIGGLVGSLGRTDSLVGYSTGSVSGTYYVGSLVGISHTTNLNGYARGTINLYAASYSTDSANYGNYFGYIVGYSDTTNNYGYYSLTESYKNGVPVDSKSNNQSTPLMLSATSAKTDFSKFTFGTQVGEWVWIADGRWPALNIASATEIQSLQATNFQTANQPTTRLDYSVQNCMATTNKPAVINNIYQITSEQELLWINNCLDGDYELKNSITLSNNFNFTPIGNSATPFTGNFNGANFSIKNLSIERSEINYIGLFGKIKDSQISNLKIEYNNLNGNFYVGAIAGYAENSTLVNVAVLQSNTNKLNGYQYVGGLVGYIMGGSLSGYSITNIDGNKFVGGLVGYAIDTNISGYTNGEIIAQRKLFSDYYASGYIELSYLGGLVGSSTNSTVYGYSTGSVYGIQYVGGLVGEATSSTVTGYTKASVTGQEFIGGLVGKATNTSNTPTVTGYTRGTVTRITNPYKFGIITQSYWGGPITVTYNLGLLVGNGNASGYYSSNESTTYPVGLIELAGVHGSQLFMDSTTTASDFSNLTFGTSKGQFTWVATERWPSINLVSGTGTEVSGTAAASADQPTKILVPNQCSVLQNKPSTVDNVYQITTENELLWINNCLNGVYELKNDITLSKDFNPIGNQFVAFNGTFDGANYTIKNLSIMKNSAIYVGFFSALDNATIKNVKFEVSKIEGLSRVGVLAGYAKNSQISNITVSATPQQTVVLKAKSYVGGLVGYAENNTTISGSNALAIEAEDFVGGLVGYAKTTTQVTGYNTASISALHDVGGLVGYADLSTVYGYNTGSMKGEQLNTESRMGGLVGTANAGNTIKGYMYGTMFANTMMGGLVGKSNNTNNIIKGYTRVYFQHTISRVSRPNGFLVASGTATGYYSYSETKIDTDEALSTYISGENGKQIIMNAQTAQTDFPLFTFSGNNGDWSWVANGSWPAINIGTIKSASQQPTQRVGNPTITGCSTGTNKPTFNANKYEISTEAHLLWIANCLDGDYKLMNNIALSDTLNFIPIGNVITPFRGKFDGQNFTISNLQIDSYNSPAGLFGNVESSEIKNLSIDFTKIKGPKFVGVLAGTVADSTITNVNSKSSKNSNIESRTYFSEYFGGLIGYLKNSTLKGYSTSNIDASTDYVGGLVGLVENSTIYGYSTGNILSNRYAGGIAAVVKNNSTIVGYTTGTITTKFSYYHNYYGGLVGQLTDSTVKGYAKGNIRGTIVLGGLVGEAENSSIIGYARNQITSIEPVREYNDTRFGYVSASVDGSSTVMGYHSSSESKFVTLPTDKPTGTNGTAISINTATQASFSLFNFSANDADWTWVGANNWPAINLGANVGPAASSTAQPTQ